MNTFEYIVFLLALRLLLPVGALLLLGEWLHRHERQQPFRVAR